MSDKRIESLMRKIEAARKKSISFADSYYKAMLDLESLIRDTDLIQSDAENADNLQDAISCYIQYGEYSLDKLRQEIESALGREAKDEN